MQYRRLRAATTFLVAFGAFLIAELAYQSASFDDPWATVGYVAVALGAGFAIGRWWTPALVTSIPVVALIAPDDEMGRTGSFLIAAVIVGPLTGVLLALGVSLRKLFRHVRSRRRRT